MRKLLLAAVLFALAGCKQGINDRCQVDSDCDNGLLCFFTGAPNPTIGGQCEPMNFQGFDASTTDGSNQHDAPPVDGETD
jgi:hypothetical protein